jgi:endonuclease/exonuclease/phosphatase family metal-dependent hydrolase
MSYNVRYFGHALRGLASTRAPQRGIAARLAGLAPLPDVICLQEVETASMRANLAFRRRDPAHTQLESFMAEIEEVFLALERPLPYTAFYFRAHRYGTERFPIYTTGLAILVNTERLEVIGHNAHAPEAITHHHTLRFRETKQTRICAHMHVRDEHGRELVVFNTHLSLPSPFARDFWRVKEKMGFGVNQLGEARTLGAYLEKCSEGRPFVVCGDFNSAPHSPVYRYMTHELGLLGAQEALGILDPTDPRAFPTAGFMRLRMHIDHMFSGGGITWLDLADTRPFGDREGVFHSFSDHVPLIGRFRLPALVR